MYNLMSFEKFVNEYHNHVQNISICSESSLGQLSSQFLPQPPDLRNT